MSIRKVAVMMPFGGTDDLFKRRCTLEFTRIRYIIENKVKVPVNDEPGGRFRQYEVKVFEAMVGEIPETAIKMINNADILIGLITEKNVNVIYELAARSLMKDVPILIVKGDPKELLPIYLQNQAYILYDDQRSKGVVDIIDEIARSSFIDLDFYKEPEEALRREIDKYDHLIGALERALIQMEAPRSPLFQELLADVARNINPEGMYDIWNSYYPSSLVRITWRKRTKGQRGYDPADAEGPPVVCAYNNEFLRLYNIAADQDGQFTAEILFSQLKDGGFINDEDMQKFMTDQQRLTDQIVMKNGFAEAEVPLRINQYHPLTEHRGKAYLPCLTMKRIIGDSQKPHNMYLLIDYINVTSFEK